MSGLLNSEAERFDRDARRPRPGRGLGAGTVQNESPHRDDQPGRFGERNEGVRQDEAARNMPPADQRLEAADSPRRSADERLVEELKCLIRQGLSKVGFERPAGLDLLVHRRIEEMISTASLALGGIERHVGIAQ